MRKYDKTFDIYNDISSPYQWCRATFGLRLARLREAQGLSARKMSLDLGQNKNYINSIETGVNFPTMEGFFNICDYLKIEPCHFFQVSIKNPYYLYCFEKLLPFLNDAKIRLLYQIGLHLGAIESDDEIPKL